MFKNNRNDNNGRVSKKDASVQLRKIMIMTKNNLSSD